MSSFWSFLPAGSQWTYLTRLVFLAVGGAAGLGLVVLALRREPRRFRDPGLLTLWALFLISMLGATEVYLYPFVFWSSSRPAAATAPTAATSATAGGSVIYRDPSTGRDTPVQVTQDCRQAVEREFAARDSARTQPGDGGVQLEAIRQAQEVARGACADSAYAVAAQQALASRMRQGIAP